MTENSQMPKQKAYLKKHVWLLISRDKQSGGWLGLPGPTSGLSQALYKHEHRYKAMIKEALQDQGSNSV